MHIFHKWEYVRHSRNFVNQYNLIQVVDKCSICGKVRTKTYDIIFDTIPYDVLDKFGSNESLT